MPQQQLASSVEKLARNPLGIIALFIVLVDAIAGTVLGTTVTTLGQTERMSLVGFVVLFPVLVLGAFYRLVTHHHTKLYAPFDFQSDAGFLQAISPDRQRERLEAEVNAGVAEVLQSSEQDIAHAAIGELAGADKSKVASGVDASAAAALLRRDHDAVQQLRANIILAEDLVFRELEAELGVPIRRHVRLNIPTGMVEVDGLAKVESDFVAIEVKYLGRNAAKNFVRRLAEAKAIAFDLAHVKPNPVRLLVALVMDETLPGNLETRLRETYAANLETVPFQVRFFEFDDLRRKFGVDATPLA